MPLPATPAALVIDGHNLLLACCYGMPDRDRNQGSEDAEPAGRLRGARISAEKRKSRRQRRRAEE
jgi:hypothetical protein